MPSHKYLISNNQPSKLMTNTKHECILDSINIFIRILHSTEFKIKLVQRKQYCGKIYTIFINSDKKIRNIDLHRKHTIDSCKGIKQKMNENYNGAI